MAAGVLRYRRRVAADPPRVDGCPVWWHRQIRNGFEEAFWHSITRDDAAAGERGNGLTNFQERLQAMRGECHVESKPGSGTTVKFIVPLAPAAQADSPA